MQVNFYDKVEDELLKFAVILSRHNGKWVFCKHKERDTYECPGGRREPGETIEETANRELREETGALEYKIEPICVYSVIGKTRVNQTEKKAMECYILLIFKSLKRNYIAKSRVYVSLKSYLQNGPIRRFNHY